MAACGCLYRKEDCPESQISRTLPGYGFRGRNAAFNNPLTSMPETSSTDIKALRQQLNRFSCLKTPPALNDKEKEEIRAALMLLNDLSDYQTLGICAESLDQGKAAADAYVSALVSPVDIDLPTREGPVYIKFNTLKGAWYLDSYSGDSRGVLITYHSSDVDEVNGTYGPFPLDLFS